MPTVIIQISNIQVSFKDRNTSYIKGEDVLSFLIGRIKKETNYNVVIATSNQAEDNIFENIALKNNIDIYRGSFINVLDRICNAANMTGEDDFVRVFANYPLVDLKEMVGLYQDHVNGGYDYSYNEHSQGVLWGTGCEIFNTKFINGLNKDNLSVSQCETISYYIRQNESRFKVL
jgi:spore coat polysaccharide biosynthesis protein SpsF